MLAASTIWVLNAVLTEPPIEPETVVARLAARHYPYSPPQLPRYAAFDAVNELDQRRAVPGFQTVSAQLVRHRRVNHDVPARPAHLYRHKNDRANLCAGGRRDVPDAHQTALPSVGLGDRNAHTAPVATAYIASEERPKGASRCAGRPARSSRCKSDMVKE